MKYFDTYGNEVDPSEAAIPDGLTAQQVFDSYLQAIGGKEKLKEVNALSMQMEASMMGQSLLMSVDKMAPNKSSLEVKMGDNVIQKQVFDGVKGKSSGMQGEQVIEGEEAEDMRISAALFEELAYQERQVAAKVVSVENINGSDAYGVKWCCHLVRPRCGITTAKAACWYVCPTA